MASGMPNHVSASITATNGHDSYTAHVQATLTRSAPAPPALAEAASGSGKKAGKKKPMDSNEASKLVAARISQLELDAAGEKDQEAEIEREVKKASRELNTVMNKMDNLQKIDHLTKRCSDLLAEMRRLERENIKNKKRGDQLQKEKDHSRTELSKTVGLKEKLEKLCRELQKENNKLKNENKTMTDAQTQNKSYWDKKYAELLAKLDGYQEQKDNPSPRKQVVDMEVDELFRQRFKSLIDQYELRELHYHSLMRTKELEVQYNLARYEREKKNAEAEIARAKQLNGQVQTFSKTESELRQQLNVYVEKFKQVEETLNNSNDLFSSFRTEMEEMSKKTKRLEKENDTLKRKHEKMNSNIFNMAEERSKHLMKIDELQKKEAKLSVIIKAMQQQGRGIPQAEAVDDPYDDVEGEADGDESEYEYEDEDGDEDGEDGEDEASEDGEEYDDETEDEVHNDAAQALEPERPPAVTTNGHQ